MNNNLVIENARIVFRNFSGKEGKYNPPGRRNFCVLLDDDISEPLKKEGWNVRYLNPRDQEESPQAYLQVAVNYDYIPPKIFMVTKKGKTLLGEEEVGMLDWAELDNVDLVIRPYNWEVNGKKGVKAYIKSLYATIVEDEFEDKYYDIPDSSKPIEPIDDDIPF